MAVTGNLQEKCGKYYVVINLRDRTGNRKQKWIKTDLPVRGNKKAAERFLREQLSIYNDQNVPYLRITVDEYFREWLKKIEKEVRPNTFRSYQGNMLNHIIPYFEKHKILLQDLKPKHIDAYYKYKSQLGSKIKSREALSPTTIKHHHQNISKALTDAVRDELISHNPAAATLPIRTVKYKAQFLNAEELKTMLKLFKGSVVEIPVTLCAVYGLRRSEVLGLKWDCVDFANRTISIEETLQQFPGGDYIDEPKTESSYRTLPMTDDVYRLLLDHKASQEERSELMGNYYIPSDYVCTWNNGQVISPNFLTKSFHSTISKSNLKQIRLHDLRHSVASNLLNMGFSLVAVQEWLGHANASTTLDTYGHVDLSTKMQMANGVQGALSE